MLGHVNDEVESALVDPPPSWRRTGRMVLAVALMLLGIWLVRDFLAVLAWAVVIALTLWPLYCRFVRRLPVPLRETGLPALLFTLLTGLVLLVPLGFAAAEAVRDAQAAAGWVEEVLRHGIPPPHGWSGCRSSAGGWSAGGAAVMFVGDNFVQPALIGSSARPPFPLVLFGVLGGLQRLGLIGLFLGPVVMAALLFLWREWTDAPAPPVRASRRLRRP